MSEVTAERAPLQMSISAKILIPLFLTMVGGFAAYALFYGFVARTRSDSTRIEIAGIQGVRAEQVGRLSYTLIQGFEWAREPLQTAVERFDSDLTRLSAGDDQSLLDPAPPELSSALSAVRSEWESIREAALRVAALPTGDPAAEAAYSDMRPRLTALNASTRALIHASEARTDRLRSRTTLTLGLICVADVLLMALGFWMIRRMVVLRVQDLESAAVRVAEGDFSQPILVGPADELGHVAHAFNDMAESIEELLARHARSQAALRSLSGKLVKAQDDERRRLAREIHDSTVQTLAAASIRLSEFQRELDPSVERTEIEGTRELIETATNELRSMSYLLHPPLLEGLGLSAALEDYLSGFSERSGVVVTFERADIARLPMEIEFALFRVAQESLWNIQRHADCDRAEIRLSRDEREVRLEIIDRGRGIDPERLRDILNGFGSGVGISGMRERVSLLGGVFELEPAHPGTLVRVTLPTAESASSSSASSNPALIER